MSHLSIILIFFGVLVNTLAIPLSDDVLRRQIARHFVIGFDGYTVPRPIEEYIKEYPPAGIILFDRNLQSPEQVKALTHSLRLLAGTDIIIMIDQEGGRVARLRPETNFPLLTHSAQSLGKKPISESYAAGYETGRLLSSLGITLNLAPVVDLAIPGGFIAKSTRSFGETPNIVIPHAQAYLEGLHAGGVKGCLKHFPGHGSGVLDPHFQWVDISDSFSAPEIDPFRALIEENLADSILVGHLFNNQWDEENPSSLSAKVIRGMLRTELGYRGLILTDDLDMAASGLNLSEASARALRAGVDLLLLCDTGGGKALHPLPEFTRDKLYKILNFLILECHQDPLLKKQILQSPKIL